eukprot:1405-Heterococcus_DN1.PRE.1
MLTMSQRQLANEIQIKFLTVVPKACACAQCSAPVAPPRMHSGICSSSSSTDNSSITRSLTSTVAVRVSMLCIALTCDNVKPNEACWNQSLVKRKRVRRIRISLSLSTVLLHAALQLLICI